MGRQCCKTATQMVRRCGAQVPTRGLIRIAATRRYRYREAQLQVGRYGRSRRQSIGLNLES